MSDWDEIRRLASDFQKAQSAGAAHKLSERNCIEIVTKLLELKLIDVIYTSDGKEYLTPQHLLKEIKDELYVSGGRISLVDLASMLNVDFSHVELSANQITKSDRNNFLVLGQLVSTQYLDNMATQVNEQLQQKGMINIASLTKEFDLPTEFIQEQVTKRLGSIIEGFRDENDPKTILTPSYIARNRARLRGVLSAVTVPTSCSSLASKFGFQDKLFMNLTDELIRTKRIPGVISGGKSITKATYIPHSYAKSQNAWIENFYASNGYIEFDSVSRLGISDPQGFLKKKFKDEKMLFLDSCCLGPGIVDQIKGSAESALNTGSWIDLVPILPSILSEDDETQLIQLILKDKPNTLVLGSTTILSTSLVEKVMSDIEATMEEKAKEDIENGVIARLVVENRGATLKDEDDKVDKKEERRKKAAGGKAGGGAQGRETKTKSTKKKGGKRKDDDWDDSDDERKGGKGDKNDAKTSDKKDLEFKSLDDLSGTLENMKLLADLPEEVYQELANHIQTNLNLKYRELAMSMYQATLAKSMHNKRKSHSELQEEINNQYTSLRLYEKGLNEIKNETHKANLAKHLLKTTAGPIIDEILLYVAEENMIKVGSDSKELSSNERQAIINELPSEIADPAKKLNKTMSSSSVEEFMKVLEDELMTICDVMLKKQDKKKDRQILFNHKHELMDKLGSCEDPALGLHLASLIVFQHFTGQILQASGKFVPNILSFVHDHLNEDQNKLLSLHQDLVIKQIKDKEAELESELQDSLVKVKEMVTNLKKHKDED